MRDLTGGADRVEASGRTVRQVIESLDAAHPGIKSRLVEDDRLKPSVGVAVDGVVSRLGLRQPVGESSEVHFLPAVSGGTSRAIGLRDRPGRSS
jgi:molybdopterin synthase sulfur carrier subunit